MIPGTENCLRVGGQVVARQEVNHAKKDLYVETTYLTDEPFLIYDTVNSRDRPPKNTTEVVTAFTTVSLTDYGPLLTHASIKALQAAGMSLLHLDQAFIVAGGFTAGRRKSFFDYSTGFNFTEGYASDVTTNLIGYTKAIGERAKISVSLEENETRRIDDAVWSLRGSQSLPDLVVSARVDERRWGNAQISLAVQRLSDDRITNCCGLLRSTLAWATSAGLELSPEVLGHQGRLLLSAAYADGAMAYLGNLPFVTDYVVDANGKIVKTSGFSLLASYEYLWSPRFKTMATVSGLLARTKTRDLEWTPTGIMASVDAEYSPFAGSRLGIEGNYYRDIGRAKYLGIKGERSTASLAKLKTYLARSF